MESVNGPQHEVIEILELESIVGTDFPASQAKTALPGLSRNSNSLFA